MKQHVQGSSSGLYGYRYHRQGGVDIHDVFVGKSASRVLFSYVGTMLLLAHVCHILLSKESLCLGSFWSISFSIILAKCLGYKPVKRVSLMIMPTFGVQLEEHFWSGRVHCQFVPIGKILKPVMNECVTPTTCYWSLALLLHNEDETMLVFKNLHPPVRMLAPIWKALCSFTNSDSRSAYADSRLNDLHRHLEQDCAVESR